VRHRRYNAIVREVAAETGAALVDLEAEAESRADVGRLFVDDRIHFTGEGARWVAERVAARVADLAAR
jgi:lysophospholipase L1-like esterase